MKATPEQYQRALKLIAMHDGNAAQAAHDCDVTLISIAPYTDRQTAKVRDICRWLSADIAPERLAARLESIQVYLNSEATPK